MRVLAVGRWLHRSVNEGTVTWLDVEYTRDVDCDLFRSGYDDDDKINPPPSPEWLIWHHDCPSGSVGQTLWNPVWPGSIDFKPQRGTAGHDSCGWPTV